MHFLQLMLQRLPLFKLLPRFMLFRLIITLAGLGGSLSAVTIGKPNSTAFPYSMRLLFTLFDIEVLSGENMLVFRHGHGFDYDILQFPNVAWIIVIETFLRGSEIIQSLCRSAVVLLHNFSAKAEYRLLSPGRNVDGDDCQPVMRFFSEALFL